MPAHRQHATLSTTFLLTPAMLLTMATAALHAQLPATPPTALQPTATAPLSATTSGTQDTRPRRAQVNYAAGQLDIRAENSSLNDILYEISVATGMKIHGGVSDQRVFGHYGPAATSDVLATLLDGTGTNMLLKEDDSLGPVELVLTPRTGGVSPPSPSTPSYSSDSDTAPPSRIDSPALRRGGPRMPPEQQQRPGSTNNDSGVPAGNPPLNNPLGSPDNTTNTVSTMPTTNSVPADSLPTPTTTTETQQGIVDSPNPPPSSTTTTATSPNGVETPDQIYQQLLKLQQQQNGSGSTTTTPPPTTTTPPQ